MSYSIREDTYSENCKKEGDLVIDLAKMIAEKRHIENEPVLLRDILPKVMSDIRRQLRSSRANAGSCDHPGRTPATWTSRVNANRSEKGIKTYGHTRTD